MRPMFSLGVCSGVHHIAQIQSSETLSTSEVLEPIPHGESLTIF